MKKLSPRAYFFKKVIDYFGIGMLVVLLLFMWTLYRGPISVPYLKPYIVEALNYDENDYSIEIGDVNIELVRSIQPIRVTARNIHLKKKDDSISIDAPKLYLSFSLRALLKGIIAPSDVNLKNPTMYVFATYGVEEEQVNEVNKKKLQFYIEKINDFLQNYNAEEKIYPESYVNNISISDGEIEFHEVDLGRQWILSDVNFEFNRNLVNMEVNANALININDKIASAGFESEYHAANDKLDLEIYFSDLILSDLMSTFNETTEDNMLSMMSIEVPVNGKIDTVLQMADILRHPEDAADYLDSAVESIKFEIDGGHGYISFNGDEKYNYDIDEMLLAGEVTGGIDEEIIKDAELKMGGQKALVSLQASGLETYILEHSLKDTAVRFVAKVPEFELAGLSRFWPRYLGEPAWEWCKNGLIGGMIKNAEFTFDFGYKRQDNSWGFLDLRGKGDIDDGDLDYLQGMPLVHDIYGTAKFSPQSIIIKIDKGVSDGVIVNKGTVNIYDLNKYNNYISIDLQGNSSVRDALKLINNPPLKLTSGMGLKPDDIEGNVDVRLKLDFELRQDLDNKDIKVDVKADLADLHSDKLVAGHLVKAEKMQLDVNGKGWSLVGDAHFDDIPVKMKIKDDFAQKDYLSKCNLFFVLDDKIKKALGIDWKILSAPSFEGFAPVNAEVTVKPGNVIDIIVKADLQKIKMDYAYFGFVKDNGQPAEANVHVIMKQKKISDIPSMSLSKSDISLSGNIQMYQSGRVKLINISKITGPKTSAQAKINMTDSATPQIRVDVSGSSYDMIKLFDKTDSRKEKEQGRVPVQENEDDGLEKMNTTNIFINVNSLWTNDTTPIQNFSGSAKIIHGIGLEELHMAGNYGIGKSIKVNVDYTPRGNKEHYLSIVSNNAGSTLKVLRFYENMVGGTLKIEARRDAQKKFVGHATVRDFSIQNAPVMTKLLSVASLTGMIDLLKGDGITFTHFNAPFEYQYKILKLNKAKAEGNVVGITTIGTYNRATDDIKMHGVIAPAYSLNRFLGKIPVVGNLLASKDGTIFAADYKIDGSVDKPEVDINSLSLLSPNSMKEWYYENFGEGSEF